MVETVERLHEAFYELLRNSLRPIPAGPPIATLKWGLWCTPFDYENAVPNVDDCDDDDNSDDDTTIDDDRKDAPTPTLDQSTQQESLTVESHQWINQDFSDVFSTSVKKANLILAIVRKPGKSLQNCWPSLMRAGTKHGTPGRAFSRALHGAWEEG